MWTGTITTIAILCVCALYVWEVYDFSTERGEPPEQPRPIERGDWDSLLGLTTSEFDRLE